MKALQNHGVGNKMSGMQHHSGITHHHVTQAHQHGLIAGTIIGSIAVSLVMAVATVIASPKLITNPFSYTTSGLTGRQPAQESPQIGAGASQLEAQANNATNGSAANSLNNFRR